MAVQAELQVVISAINKAKAVLTSIAKDVEGVGSALRGINGTDVGAKQSQQLKNLGSEAKITVNTFTDLVLKTGLVVEATKRLIALPETYKQVNAQLRIAASSQNDFNISQQATTDIARDTGSSLQGVVGLYSKLRNNANLASVDALKLTEIIGKATKLDGGGAGADAAIFQLQQGLSSGALRGEELNSVLEQTPSLAKAIADGLGTNVGGLRAIAAEGKLTAEVVKEALFKVQGDVDAKFAQLPITTGRAFENLVTNATVAFGKIDEQLGITTSIANAIQSVADNITPLTQVGAVIAAIFAGLKIQALVASSGILTLAGSTSILGGVLGVLLGPVTLVVGALAGLVALFTSAINETNALTETVVEPVTAFETLGAAFSLLVDIGGSLLSILGEAISSFFDFGGAAVASTGDVTKSFTSVDGLIRKVFNFIVNALPALGRLILTVGKTVGEGILLYYKTLFDGTVAVFKDVQKVFQGDFTFTNSKKALNDVKNAGRQIGDSFNSGIAETRKILQNDTAGDILSAVSKRVQERRKQRQPTGDFTGSDGKGNPAVAKATAGSSKVSDDEIKANKEALDRILEDIKANLSQARKVYDEAYAQNLVGVEEYYAARSEIVNRQAQAELDKEASTIAELQAQRAKVQNLSTGGKAAAEEAKKSKIAGIDREIEATNGRILTIERDRNFALNDISRSREKDLNLLKEEIAALNLANRATSGLATAEERADAVRQRNAALLKKAEENQAEIPNAVAVVKRKIEIEVNQAELDKAEEQIRGSQNRLRTAQESIDIQVKAGVLTETQAREKLVQLNQVYAADLEALLPTLEKAANAIGGDAVAKVQQWKNAIAEARIVIDETAVRINGELKDAGTNAFKDFITGAKSASDAIKSFVADFAESVAEIASQKFSESLFNNILGSGESGGVGGFLSGFLGGGGSSSKKGQTPTDPLYVSDTAVTSGLVENPAEAVVGDFFTQVKDGFFSLVDIGSNVFNQIGGFITNLLSSTGGSGDSGGGIGGLFKSALSLIGFADGGYVSGAGTGTSDSIVARLSNGEHVTNARQTSKWLPLLNAINSGALDSISTRVPTRPYFADGGLVTQAADSKAKSDAETKSGKGVRILNVVDPALAKDYLDSPDGEATQLNFITRNAGSIKQIILNA